MHSGSTTRAHGPRIALLRFATASFFAAALIAGSSATALAGPVGSADSGSATALVTGSASGSANSGSATPGTGSAYYPNSGSAKFGERASLLGPRIAAGIEQLVRALGLQSGIYLSCADAERTGAAPLLRGTPGYNSALDPDGDGIACD